jgi:hypothetical protein
MSELAISHQPRIVPDDRAYSRIVLAAAPTQGVWLRLPRVGSSVCSSQPVVWYDFVVSSFSRILLIEGQTVHSNVRLVGAFRKCAFLFLALSVFWFGLHARLEAYKPAASNISDSKISTEKHSAQVLKVLDKQDGPADDLNALVLGLFLRGFHSVVTPLPLGEVARIKLADPRRLDLSGVYSLHGPPATTL